MSHNETTDTLFEQSDIEIDKQTNLAARKSEVRKYLGFVDRGKLLYHLKFYHYPLLNQQVKSVSLVQIDFFINQWESFLSFNGQPQLFKFVNQASFIGRL